eukprot:jgi/Ulvmu1/10594/UM065_0048.1
MLSMLSHFYRCSHVRQLQHSAKVFMPPNAKQWWNISPSSAYIHAWEWFILVMVLYNLFSAPYIVSFVASEKCGKGNALIGILRELSSACQSGDGYVDVLSNSPDATSFDLDKVAFEFYLPCASNIFSLVNIASDCAFFTDIVLSFVTGYVPRHSSLPEYNMRSIALNYVKDTFAFDAIATFPWEPVVRVLFPSASGWLGLKLINLVRFFRLIKVQRKLGAYLSTPWVHLGCVAGVYLMCAHCLASVLFFIGRWQVKDLELGAPNDFVGAPWVINECLQFADATTQYSVAFYWAVTTITTVGYGDIVPNTNTDKVFIMLAMFFSGTLQAAILANVAVAVESLQAKHTLIATRIRQFMAGLKFHDIPAPLTSRVLDSIEYYASQRYGVQDQDTLQVFPHRLQVDIAHDVLSTVQPCVSIFEGCSHALLRELSLRWAMMITPPSEHVLVSGAPAMEVYQLVTGTCIARTSSGIYIDTLGEGSAIGHLDAVLGTTCGADVVAKTYCTMYCLSTLDLWEILQACHCLDSKKHWKPMKSMHFDL